MRAPVLATALLAAQMAAAQTPEQALRRVIERPAEASAFAPSFLAAVPMAQLEAILAPLRAEIGPPLSVVVAGDTATITTATHRLPASITLNADGLISGLFVEAPIPLARDLDAALAGLRDIGGTVAWLVTRDGVVMAAEGQDSPLAVASAFKLGVLAVLARDVAAGRRDWADVVRLQDRHRSLPTGQMQDWPGDAPVTLHTAALLMISQSDNTATDLLIDTVGRDRVAAALGIAPDRMLTTRAFFALKADGAARADWLAAVPQDRAGIADRAAQDVPDIGRASVPHVQGVEWYVPLTRLCALMDEVGDLPLMSVNRGPVLAQDWGSFGYKGGSEGGVLNFTARLVAPDGAGYCLAATWNAGKEIDLARATTAWRGVTATLIGLH